MKKFIDDMINMTEGQKLIHYWWLWLIIIVLVALCIVISNKRR